MKTASNIRNYLFQSRFCFHRFRFSLIFLVTLTGALAIVAGLFLNSCLSRIRFFPSSQPCPALPTTPSVTTASYTKTTFTGRGIDCGSDKDDNGRFRFLEVNVELVVAQAGGYGFTTALVDSQGELIAVGALTTDRWRTAPVASMNLEAGRQLIPIYFDGRAIRASKIDGPYTVSILLSGETDELDHVVLTTQGYNHLEFQ